MAEPMAQVPADAGSDDLPRTIRREREARYREALERVAAREREAPPASSGAAPAAPGAVPPSFGAPEPVGASMMEVEPMDYGEARPAVVTAIKIPFLRLVAFFLKAALAAIPALVMLGVLLWLLSLAMPGHLHLSFKPPALR